jgi:hypothetical protein
MRNIRSATRAQKRPKVQLYHQNCRSVWPLWAKFLPRKWRSHRWIMPARGRLWLVFQGVGSVRQYICAGCNCKIAIDMDWEEGATPEDDGRID